MWDVNIVYIDIVDFLDYTDSKIFRYHFLR